VKVSPFANAAVTVPEALLGLVQLNFTEFAPDSPEPEPLFIVAQPTASPTTNRQATLEVAVAMRPGDRQPLDELFMHAAARASARADCRQICGNIG
jgi:hypothetical protein